MTSTDVDTDPDDLFIPLPRESSRRRKVLWVLGSAALVFVLVFVIAGFWLKQQVDPGSPGDEVAVTVPVGATTAQIATMLEDQGVVTNATIFQLYVRWKGYGPFEAGTYDGLRANSSMGSVAQRLEEGPLPPAVTYLSVPEGSWLAETAATMLATFPEMNELELFTALSTVRSAYQPEGNTNLEGLLFPATYEVEEGDELDEQKLVRQMVEKFDQVGDELGLADASTRLAVVAGDRVITPYEVVIVASLIQAEAGVPEDRAKIARVIYNRLAAGEQLGIDATVMFALGERVQEITANDLRIDSPYNTRRFAGLPPGPINSPSREALEAALNPAEGDWRYYVLTDESGAHSFFEDYDDFLAAADDARARGVF